MKRWLAGLVGLALVTVSCSHAPPAHTPAGGPAGPAGVAPLVSPAGPVPGGIPSPEAAGGTAALNSQLLRKASAPAAAGDLPLGPGDLVEITVFEVPELSSLKVRVSRPGTVTLPLIGQLPVAGKTPGEVEAELRARLGRTYMHDPHVTVFVHERKSQRISVIGAVRKGGVFELSGRLRLADALALAEGLADDADHVVYLFRRVPAGTVARAEADARARAGNGTALPAAGAPPASAMAPDRPASENGATEEVMTAINLEAVARGSDELNVPLEAGDVIQVPRAGSIYVGGSVARPGSLPLKAKTTVHQAILAAGGANHVAALADVRLYRTRADGQIEVVELDLNDFEAGKGSPELQKNDVVIVGKSAVKAIFFGVYDLFRGMFGVGIGL